MKPVQGSLPDIMPVLSRGKHRTPKSGGCFMEFASYLAGESWSDHPACTHPVLASLARMVNDCSSDDARSRLALLIPSVIGLTGSDRRVEVAVALRAGCEALPVASLERQRALAVGVLTCERNASILDPALAERMRPLIRAALDEAPDAERWARDFIGSAHSWSHTKFTPRTADTIIRVAVQGIGEACIADPDARLYTLLDHAISDCRDLLGARTLDRTVNLPALA
ncbi:hypothetical protein [Cryobacterium sp. PH31-L1]|uniref:hypothetical protein n=1 Tax=Cryobacterium sp. PH31-L1 TaxID=3046199 RepID=UPI0024BAE7F2|nr:hypothetical protein [Cryobacterium sp. PH31-L1]MDJ0378020.1 hypothetical protein [Cryobacterium sp. PH31-L1]